MDSQLKIVKDACFKEFQSVIIIYSYIEQSKNFVYVVWTFVPHIRQLIKIELSIWTISMKYAQTITGQSKIGYLWVELQEKKD